MSAENTTLERPAPGEYSDYREYLRDMIAYWRRTKPSFSYRWFSRRAGYTSPNFLKLVAEGKRNLSQDSILRFAQALDLSSRERETFELLVHLTQAKSDEERNHYYTRLRKRRARGKAREIARAQFDVYSKWWVLPVRELLAEPDFQEDPSWIARRIYPRITAAAAAEALAILEASDLVHRRPDGTLVPHDTKLTAIPAPVGSLAIRNYHRAMLGNTMDALDRLPVAERNVTSLTVRTTRAQYEELSRRIADFRRELLDLVEDAPDRDASGEVYFVGFQIVPVTRSDS